MNIVKVKKEKNYFIFWLLIIPVLLVRGICSLYPIINTFYSSFFQINKIMHINKFIGIRNFIDIFSDIKVLETLHFTAFFTLVSIALHTIIGVALALLLNKEFKGRKLLRTVVLIPWALPLIVAGIAAAWGFNDSYGFVNDIIRRLATGFHFDWLSSSMGAQIAVILADVWKDTPFYAIMILAGLQSIPTEIYEAAHIDGASSIKVFWSITIPNIAPLMVILTIFFSLWRLTQFDLIYAMTKGGPGNSTSLLSYRVYVEAFNNQNFGYASSISVLLCLIMIAIAIIGFAINRKIDFES